MFSFIAISFSMSSVLKTTTSPQFNMSLSFMFKLSNALTNWIGNGFPFKQDQRVASGVRESIYGKNFFCTINFQYFEKKNFMYFIGTVSLIES